MTIGLKNRPGTTFRQKKIKDFRRNVALLLFFVFRFFLQYLDDLPVVHHIDFIWIFALRFYPAKHCKNVHQYYCELFSPL